MKFRVYSLALLVLPMFFTCKSANAEVDMGTYINLCKTSQDVCQLMFYSTLDGIEYGSLTNENYRVGSDTKNQKLFFCWDQVNKKTQGQLFDEFYGNLIVEQFSSGPNAKVPLAYAVSVSLKSRYL